MESRENAAMNIRLSLLRAAAQTSAVTAFVDVAVVPMDAERVVPGRTVVVQAVLVQAGVMVKGRWRAEQEINARLAAIAASPRK